MCVIHMPSLMGCIRPTKKPCHTYLLFAIRLYAQNINRLFHGLRNAKVAPANNKQFNGPVLFLPCLQPYICIWRSGRAKRRKWRRVSRIHESIIYNMAQKHVSHIFILMRIWKHRSDSVFATIQAYRTSRPICKWEGQLLVVLYGVFFSMSVMFVYFKEPYVEGG